MLRRAADVDTTLADLLRRAATEQIDDGTGSSLLGAAVNGLAAAALDLPAPPVGAAPAGNTAWWAGLSRAEQDRVIAEHPEWIGNLDGIPASTRDDVNRARLPTEIARLDTELAAATARWEAGLDQTLPPGMEGQGETRDQLALRADMERLRVQREALGTIAQTVRSAAAAARRQRPRRAPRRGRGR